MDQRTNVKQFYDDYGMKEWERLERDANSRLIHHLHWDFLKPHLQQGNRVLDVGCGAGRYSVDMAREGCLISMVDLSDEQIAIAKAKMKEAGLWDQVDSCEQGDITDLSMFANESFDTVVCYGAVLNYLMENQEQAIAELHRVLKRGGVILASVISTYGCIRQVCNLDTKGVVDFFARPNYWQIDEVMTSGNLVGHPEVNHPDRHFYDAESLSELFYNQGFIGIKLGCAPCLFAGQLDLLSAMEQDDNAWQTVLSLEEQAYTRPHMSECGDFLLLKGIKMGSGYGVHSPVCNLI